MIKKIVKIILAVLILMIAFGQSFYAEGDLSGHTKDYYYFGSDEDPTKAVRIRLDIYTDEESFAIYDQQTEQILRRYHTLTNNKIDLTGNNEENSIYDINENPNQWLDIPKELFDLLIICQEYQEITKGHFDVTIGLFIDIWKKAIDENIFDTISDADFIALSNQVAALKEIFPKEDCLLLKTENGKYWAMIKDYVKLDLGAIAKGYAIEQVKKYLLSQNVKYYLINAGSSSINFGTYLDRNGDDSFFEVTLADPFFPLDINGYGKLSNISKVSIATSGNNNQYFLYNGRRYHHIISPLTFEPTEGIASITIIGNDSGQLDAYSTALFSMTIVEAKSFLSAAEYNYSIYKDDGHLEGKFTNGITFIENTDRKMPFDNPYNSDEYHYGNWILIGIIAFVALILIGISCYFIIKIIKNPLQDKKLSDSKIPKIKKTTIRDILMVGSIAVLALAVFGIYSLWPHEKYDFVRVRRNNEVIAIIDYQNKEVSISDELINNEDIIVVLNLDEKTISILDAYAQEHIIMVIGFDYEEKSAWVIEADCSDQSCVKIGKIYDASKTIICLPNKIQIKFEE